MNNYHPDFFLTTFIPLNLCQIPHILKSNAQLIEINWVENDIKSLIRKLSFSKLRFNTYEERQRNYFFFFFAYIDQLPFIIRDKLNISNSMMGYILLVDQNF